MNCSKATVSVAGRCCWLAVSSRDWRENSLAALGLITGSYLLERQHNNTVIQCRRKPEWLPPPLTDVNFLPIFWRPRPFFSYRSLATSSLCGPLSRVFRMTLPTWSFTTYAALSLHVGALLPPWGSPGRGREVGVSAPALPSVHIRNISSVYRSEVLKNVSSEVSDINKEPRAARIFAVMIQS